MTKATFPCACCGFLVFDEPPGSYAVCTICGWEDDAVQLANPCTRGGANSSSLAEAQESFQFTTPEADLEECREQGYVRDSKWRPLNVNEKEVFQKESDNGTRLVHPAVAEIGECYWRKNIVHEKT
jgi:hypothetical protein